MNCGLPVPDGQNVCSMCYGDIDYGADGYYEEWARQELRRQEHEIMEAEYEAWLEQFQRRSDTARAELHDEYSHEWIEIHDAPAPRYRASDYIVDDLPF